MILDCHHHYMPEEISRGLLPNWRQTFWKGVPDSSVEGTFANDRFWRIEDQLADMDAAGVDVTVLECSAGLHATLEGCRFINDRTAAIVQQHPNRVVGLANVAALEPDATDEMERAIRQLGLKGFFIPCQIERRPLDFRGLWPFWRKAADLGVPVFIHPAHIPPQYELIDDFEHPPYYHRLIGREFDLAIETLRLIFGGVLDEFADLKIVMSHFGGGLAGAADRVRRIPGEHINISKPVEDYLATLSFDMAGFFGGMNAVKCALTLFEPRQLVFGTDYPLSYCDRPDLLRQYIDGIRALPLLTDEIDGMLATNGLALFETDALGAPKAASSTG